MLTRFSSAASSTCVLAFLLSVGAAAGAQCVVHRDERDVGHLDGMMVASVEYETIPPSGFGIGSFARHLHARTTTATLKRLFDQASAVRIDSLRLAESLRRLQQSSLFSHVELDAQECVAKGSATLTVRATDAWSARGGLRINRDGAAATLGEDNFLGSGRSVRTSVRVDQGRLGFGVQYSDPWLAGYPISLAFRHNRYRGATETAIRIASASRSVLDAWRTELLATSSSRQSLLSNSEFVARRELRVDVERRLFTSDHAVSGGVVGFERTQASLTAFPSSGLVGPSQVNRDFSGLMLGYTRRSLSFRPQPLARGMIETRDFPDAVEVDAAVSLGWDRSAGRPAQYVDAWIGKIWAPHGSAIVSANAWWSGYRSDNGWNAGDTRASILFAVPAASGLWTTRIASELLLDPDPDIRALVSLDPTARLFPARGLAEAASIFSVERSQTFHSISQGYALGGALFMRASRRWDLAAADGDRMRQVALLGAGLRLLPRRTGRATFNVDVALPVGNVAVRIRPVLLLSISPWFESERHRDRKRGQ